MVGSAQEIFDLLMLGKWTAIEAYREIGREETLHLEFKGKASPTASDLEPEDRRHLSETLSAFANSDGGVLVWGLRTGQARGVDRVIEVLPINGLSRFISELRGATPDLVSGPLPGVRHEPIVQGDGSGDVGVAVTLIPASDSAPHMATGKGLHRYYHRVGNRTLHMEHYQVADMFGRRPQPDLRLAVPWEVEGGNVTGFWLRLLFIVSNQGRAIARFPCLTIGAPPKSWSQYNTSAPAELAGPFQVTDAPHGWIFRYQGSADSAIYPGDKFKVVTIGFPLGRMQVQEGLTLDAEVVAEGAALSRVRQVISLADLEYASGWVLQNGRTFTSEDHPDRGS